MESKENIKETIEYAIEKLYSSVYKDLRLQYGLSINLEDVFKNIVINKLESLQ